MVLYLMGIQNLTPSLKKPKMLELRVPTARKRSLNIRLRAKGFFVI